MSPGRWSVAQFATASVLVGIAVTLTILRPWLSSIGLALVAPLALPGAAVSALVIGAQLRAWRHGQLPLIAPLLMVIQWGLLVVFVLAALTEGLVAGWPDTGLGGVVALTVSVASWTLWLPIVGVAVVTTTALSVPLAVRVTSRELRD